ncbi:MAG: amidohydrolase [Candidatus Latescibacteria bacterium]|nr:amidohydrolase [Candidatus Latescibacterota bacterium]
MNTRDNKLSRRTFVGSMAGIGAGMSIAREAAAEAKYDAGSPVFEHTTPGIIDIHTHFSSDMDSKAHLEATKTSDKTVVFGGTDNDAVKAQVDLAPDRLIFFTRIYPDKKGFMDELERTHQDLGAKGIKLGPVYCQVHPLEYRHRQIYAYAEKHNLPILTHMAETPSRSGPLEYARPIHMDSAAMDYPDLKIILAHMGHPWIGETISIVRRQPNVYADISALYYRPFQFYSAIRLAIEYSDRPTVQKLFFGSDYMGGSTGRFIPQVAVDGVRNMNHIVGEAGFPKIPEEIINNILHNDSLSILGIS